MLKNSVGNLIRSKRKELNPFLLISLLGFESKIVLQQYLKWKISFKGFQPMTEKWFLILLNSSLIG